MSAGVLAEEGETTCDDLHIQLRLKKKREREKRGRRRKNTHTDGGRCAHTLIGLIGGNWMNAGVRSPRSKERERDGKRPPTITLPSSDSFERSQSGL